GPDRAGRRAPRRSWRSLLAAHAPGRDHGAGRIGWGRAEGGARAARRPRDAPLCLARLWRGADACLAHRADRGDRRRAWRGGGPRRGWSRPALAGREARCVLAADPWDAAPILEMHRSPAGRLPWRGAARQKSATAQGNHTVLSGRE